MSALRSAARELRHEPRQHVPSVVVTAVGAAFGTVLLLLVQVLSDYLLNSAIGEADAVKTALSLLATVFLAIAVFVAAIVTANTFGTIIAGRVRTIALYRLIGASARSLRGAVAAEGFLIGAIGAVLGVLVGCGLVAVGVLIAQPMVGPGLLMPAMLDQILLVPLLASFLSTWLASWAGTRSILAVTPIQALGDAREQATDEIAGRRVRLIAALILVVFGAGLLALGVVRGQSAQDGILIAFGGGLVSFIGVVLGAEFVMPTLLRGMGALFGRGPAARLGAANAVRNPQRSTRSTLGIVIGVTLITMFAVASETLTSIILTFSEDMPAEFADEIRGALNSVVMGIAVLIGFSVLIAVIGLVNTLSLSVLQRSREIGLLRAIGFTARQVRTMIMLESLQMAFAAVAFGLVLGTVYGWAGAQALLGGLIGGFVAPAVPWPLILGTILATAVIGIVAALVPARRATRVAPVVALGAE